MRPPYPRATVSEIAYPSIDHMEVPQINSELRKACTTYTELHLQLGEQYAPLSL